MFIFQRPVNADKVKLVVRSVNTKFMDLTFDELQKLKGNSLLKWYYDLDNNQKERMRFFNFLLREGTLKIKIMQNGVWINTGQMLYVGADIEKEQVAVLDIGKITDNILKIKIESTTGLWKINKIYADYSSPEDYQLSELSPDKVIDASGNDVTYLLSNNDDKYYTSIENQTAVLTFNEIPIKNDFDRIFILKTKGYYLQWFNPSELEPSELYHRVMDEPLFAGKIFLPLWKAEKNKNK